MWSTFTRRGGWWVAAQAVVMALMAGSWFVSDGDWGTWSWVVGWALAGAGLVVGAWAMLALGDNLTPYPSPRQGTELVERGPYRVARHPIYGAIVLGSVGLSLVAGSGPGLALAGVLAALFTRQVLRRRAPSRRLGARIRRLPSPGAGPTAALRPLRAFASGIADGDAVHCGWHASARRHRRHAMWSLHDEDLPLDARDRLGRLGDDAEIESLAWDDDEPGADELDVERRVHALVDLVRAAPDPDTVDLLREAVATVGDLVAAGRLDPDRADDLIALAQATLDIADEQDHDM
ncbi:MAG: isoprenylcysteine carboxylmethyltransferase family protein [Acidimicrobiia bacterium]|nr:isoprenylcysteine carboxylmethyltransferase family protein [Acidimicrobiia bacterium]